MSRCLIYKVHAVRFPAHKRLCYFNTARRVCQELFKVFSNFSFSFRSERTHWVYHSSSSLSRTFSNFFRSFSSSPSSANFDSLTHLFRFVKNFFKRLSVPRALFDFSFDLPNRRSINIPEQSTFVNTFFHIFRSFCGKLSWCRTPRTFVRKMPSCGSALYTL